MAKAENYIVSMTVFEVVLLAVMLFIVTGISAAGAGFYFGANLSRASVVDHTKVVLELCNKVVDHEDDRAAAWKASSASCTEEVGRYRAWLIDVEDSSKVRATVPHAKKSGRGGL